MHYVPGEHDILDEDAKLYTERYGRGTQGRRLVQLRRQRRALHRPRQRGRSQGRRSRQSRRRAARVARSRPQGPLGIDADRRVRPHPAVDGLPELGLGHRGRRPRARLAQALRLGDRAQRPHPPGDAEGRGQRHVPHRPLDRVPAAGAGHRAVAGADEGRRRQAARLPRHRRRHLQARRRPARHHRQAAAGVSHENGNKNGPRRGLPGRCLVSKGRGCEREDRQLHVRSAPAYDPGRHDRDLDQRGRHPAHASRRRTSRLDRRRSTPTTSSRSPSRRRVLTSIFAPCTRT